MPQDGSNNYQYPPGTPGIPDTTIESEAYNTFLDDLVINDLNIPRPIHRGGTGANNADQALANLHGEKAEQVVTAYLSQLWVPGSFRSAAGATDAPVAGHSFAGICYINEPLVFPPTNANVIIEARDQNDTTTPGRVYVREKKANVWGAWTVQAGSSADLDAAYVNVSGDTMTGTLNGTQFNSTISPGYAFVLNGTSPVRSYGLSVATGSGNFSIDDITAAANRMIINPAGAVSISGPVTTGAFGATGGIRSATSPTVGIYYFGDSGTKTLSYDGSDFAFGGGQLIVNNDIVARRSGAPTQGLVQFGNTGTKYLYYDAVNFNFVGGDVISTSFWAGSVNHGMLNGGAGNLYFRSAANYFFQPSSGASNLASLDSGGNLVVLTQGYKPAGGSWAATSDARIKNELGDYTRGLNEIATLRPIYFTYKGNDTAQAPAHISEEDKAANKALTVPYPNSAHSGVAKSATKYAGLIAQEVEATFPEMVNKRSAYIDGQPVDDLRDLDTTPLIFALINAVKELKARIEALEG